MASYTERIASKRAPTPVVSPTIEKLNRYIREQVGALTLLFELPEIDGLSYAKGLRTLKEERAGYDAIFREKAPELQFPFVVGQIFSTLAMASDAIVDHPELFSPAFHQEIRAMQGTIATAINQSNDAVSRGLMLALQQIHEKETRPGTYIHHRGRLDLDTFRLAKQAHVKPLYETLDVLESQIEKLPKETSRDTALADYLGNTTRMVRSILKETDRTIRGTLEPPQNGPSR